MTADLYSWQNRTERKRLAERLYGDGWAMQRIAEALKVSQATITRDLAEFIPANQPTRAKGGRPKEVNNPSRVTAVAASKPAPVTAAAGSRNLFTPNKPAPATPAASSQQTKPAESQQSSADKPNWD